MLQYKKFRRTVSDEMSHLMICLNKIHSQSPYTTTIALLGNHIGKYANFLTAVLTLAASALNLVNGGSNAAINVGSTVLALVAVLGMAVGNSTVSPDSMMEIQDLAQKIEIVKAHCFGATNVPKRTSVPQEFQEFCVDGIVLTNRLAFTLGVDQDTYKRVRIIPHTIVNDVLDRSKRVENDAWLSSALHIQFPIPTAARTKNLITGLFPVFPMLSKSRTEPLLPLYIVMSPRSMTPETPKLILPSASVVEIPDVSTPTPTEYLSAEAEAPGSSGYSFMPQTTTRDNAAADIRGELPRSVPEDTNSTPGGGGKGFAGQREDKEAGW
ncbi:hypothetical protein IW262DRAFT_1486552 [Armillaria fumosa]|nr:hypothetical protein IW262DRAFT_1486552 [Armillaria fumosa]